MARPHNIIAVIVIVATLAVLISLGNWQMRRLAWKEDLIARVSDRMQSAPLRLAGIDMAGLDAAAYLEANEYRPVTLEGRFLSGATVRVYTVLSDPKGQLQGPGYWVLTPLETEYGQTVFINRGFVPFDDNVEYPRPPGGIVQVSGPLRSPERGNFMTPEPDIQERIWYIRNPAGIAVAMSLDGEVLPFFIDADATLTPEGGLPQAGETRTVFTNSHLQYAITWYGLAAALAGVCAVYILRRQNSTAA